MLKNLFQKLPFLLILLATACTTSDEPDRSNASMINSIPVSHNEACNLFTPTVFNATESQELQIGAENIGQTTVLRDDYGIIWQLHQTYDLALPLLLSYEWDYARGSACHRNEAPKSVVKGGNKKMGYEKLHVELDGRFYPAYVVNASEDSLTGVFNVWDLDNQIDQSFIFYEGENKQLITTIIDKSAERDYSRSLLTQLAVAIGLVGIYFYITRRFIPLRPSV